MIDPWRAGDRAGKDVGKRDNSIGDDVPPDADMQPEVEVLDLKVRHVKNKTKNGAQRQHACPRTEFFPEIFAHRIFFILSCK